MKMKIAADSFVCLNKMTAVRHYFVDNLRDDLICELDHGCDPIPVTREMIAGIQAQDPRCAD
jgi:hypothetical protein